jgi:hypothetical protein
MAKRNSLPSRHDSDLDIDKRCCVDLPIADSSSAIQLYVSIDRPISLIASRKSKV